MKRIRPTFVIAVLALVIALGGTTMAASNAGLILQSGSGHAKATVSNNGQLLTTEALPSQFVNIAVKQAPNLACRLAYTVPAGKELVIRDITAYFESSVASPASLYFYTDKDCESFTGISPEAAGYITVPMHFSDGYVVHAGGHLYSQSVDGSVSALVSGYLTKP